MELYFSKEEMVDFLERNGYTIETVKTWKSHNVYHNQVENTYHNVEVAYTERFNVFSGPDGVYRDLSIDPYKVEKVFKEALKKKLLSF